MITETSFDPFLPKPRNNLVVLPDGWIQVKLASIADIRFSGVDKKSSPGEKPVFLCNYMNVYNKEYVQGNDNFMSATASESEISRFEINSGDVIITKDSETPDDIGIPAVVVAAPKNLICGYHLALIRPKQDQVDPLFLAKQLAHNRISRYFARLANGMTRYGLTTAVIENTPIWLPPIEEQRKIAKSLHTVDEAIQRTEQLIAKLKAIKQGLLHDLLTRGLDENGQLRDPIAHPDQFKDSPLGRIPKEWEIYRINEIGKVVSGTTPSRMVPQYWGGTIPWITPTDMSKLTNDYISGGQDSITQSGLESCSANLLPIGSIVVTTRATLGLTAVAERELATNQGFKNIIPNNGWNSLFLCYKIRELSNEMIKRASGTTFLEISGTQFRLLKITAPVPGSKEQDMIANAISIHNQRIEKEEQYLAKLKLIKKGLMHDLLTGKVRVNIKTENLNQVKEGEL
jgi:type I restriction enzyme S subunit